MSLFFQTQNSMQSILIELNSVHNFKRDCFSEVRTVGRTVVNACLSKTKFAKIKNFYELVVGLFLMCRDIVLKTFGNIISMCVSRRPSYLIFLNCEYFDIFRMSVALLVQRSKVNRPERESLCIIINYTIKQTLASNHLCCQNLNILLCRPYFYSSSVRNKENPVSISTHPIILKLRPWS